MFLVDVFFSCCISITWWWIKLLIFFLSVRIRTVFVRKKDTAFVDCATATVSAASGRYRLRSTGSAAYVLPRTTKFGERGFFYSSPAAWNTLSPDLHDITDTSTFRKRLKNVLFDRAYNWLLLAHLDESYSGALQISRWLIDWLIAARQYGDFLKVTLNQCDIAPSQLETLSSDIVWRSTFKSAANYTLQNNESECQNEALRTFHPPQSATSCTKHVIMYVSVTHCTHQQCCKMGFKI